MILILITQCPNMLHENHHILEVIKCRGLKISVAHNNCSLMEGISYFIAFKVVKGIILI